MLMQFEHQSNTRDFFFRFVNNIILNARNVDDI